MPWADGDGTGGAKSVGRAKGAGRHGSAKGAGRQCREMRQCRAA